MKHRVIDTLIGIGFVLAGLGTGLALHYIWTIVTEAA